VELIMGELSLAINAIGVAQVPCRDPAQLYRFIQEKASGRSTQPASRLGK
jgi:hypothetical protein